MAYLHSDREQFRDAIDLAYEQTGVMVQAIEKDYYVTMLLRLLAQKIRKNGGLFQPLCWSNPPFFCRAATQRWKQAKNKIR